MVRNVRRWIVAPLVTLLAASFVLYTAVGLQPGNPLTLLLGTKASPAQYRYLAHKLGLDRPMLVRYWAGEALVPRRIVSGLPGCSQTAV